MNQYQTLPSLLIQLNEHVIQINSIILEMNNIIKLTNNNEFYLKQIDQINQIMKIIKKEIIILN